MYFQLLRDRKKELSIKFDAKSKSKTTNRSSKQFSRTNTLSLHDVEMATTKIPYQLHWVTYFCEM
jgi:hypothetical protein